ncbi:hypothetical protein [Lysinibacillus sp. NPDC096212]|uniref:hypothetical protein n=1 Tax=Lysinibacillus sp. NPDC096212 TaxID=3364135 RepID=UPI00381B9B45
MSSFNITRQFTGSINGNGFTVKNVNYQHLSNVGMVPHLYPNAVLKNISFQDINLSTATGATSRAVAIVGDVRSATLENVEFVNCSVDVGENTPIASIVRNLTGTFKVKNIRMINVTVKGGTGNTGFFSSVNTAVAGYSFSDGVFTGKFTGQSAGVKSDGIFGHIPDGSLFFYKVYVLDKDLPQFDHSKGCATYVTDAQLKDPNQIPLSTDWNHSSGQYPTLKIFSGDTGKQITVRGTIKAKKGTVSATRGRGKAISKTVTARKAVTKDSLHYSTRMFVTAKKTIVTVNTYKVRLKKVNSTFKLGKATTNYKLLRNVLRSFPIDLGRVTLLSNVVYPSLGNVPVYAYTGIITGRSNTECRTTQSSIYRIL